MWSDGRERIAGDHCHYNEPLLKVVGEIEGRAMTEDVILIELSMKGISELVGDKVVHTDEVFVNHHHFL